MVTPNIGTTDFEESKSSGLHWLIIIYILEPLIVAKVGKTLVLYQIILVYTSIKYYQVL